MGDVAEEARRVLKVQAQIYRKTVQAFRIRTQLHLQRETALATIRQRMQQLPKLRGEKFEQAVQAILNQSEDQINILRDVLRKEKRVFRWIEKKDKDADQIIKLAMSKLRDQIVDIKKVMGKEIKLEGGYTIRIRDVQNFLGTVHSFLRTLRKDVRRLKSRIKREESELKHNDAKHFLRFLKVWEKETKNLWRLNMDIADVISDTPTFAQRSRGKISAGDVLQIVFGALLIGTSSGMAANNLTSSGQMATGGLLFAVGLVMLTWPFINLLGSVLNEGTAWTVEQEREMVQGMEKVFG